MIVQSIGAIMLTSEDPFHELADAHVDELAHFIDHDLTVDLVLRLIEFKFPFLFLSVEHDSARVFQLPLQIVLELVVLRVHVMLVL
eukprot:CAMPEP_0185589318 /NCGR_PEP_ID=MMETSP0434-20130131/56527_1 /TAXON_ID=626734 ORGANISM="Favella taraikaensis, Strain Fe Narragansett Bay" /NCGR_SAMPLE_ID=MMETSP0434 /ASSEMBLY_ACC=CAM_ASM_000379 /LENGTH=85 /DNA_ID=CAMNT_0028212611 /DNA_START=636 /DNA_END=893 /DNA_ORIENTATION=+